MSVFASLAILCQLKRKIIFYDPYTKCMRSQLYDTRRDGYQNWSLPSRQKIRVLILTLSFVSMQL